MAGNLKCPECEKETMECRYVGDFGGVDYMDVYEAGCKSCGFTDKKSVDGGSPLADNWVTECPFCGETYLKHPSYKKELLNLE